MYVVEGTVRYTIGDETISAGPGAVFHIPAGTLEHFEPAGDGFFYVRNGMNGKALEMSRDSNSAPLV